ncbi:CidA/LrgA family protein [Candidatus Venteria ishoeyi]|uniref:Antiholin-like protein LrgA n=1 Tax=Candidatus Venteria ishoeyi TaxID=1899563 RepID=A0A1H6FE41_9GAMM|nr:CidA/LrgA family protein [Candidatus Venteria ishoeyi]MDM8545889.1 CidA/LrgA family protein [Candidatus Venteria ishoeyi]SEH08350.1 Uncharacterised protein [Candidatus Venteria ishoeyi]
MNFINGITILLLYQLIGEISVLLLKIPVPGPVVGMLLLFLSLLLRHKLAESLATSSNALLTHLPLLFVPAGVGVMVHFQRLQNEWLPITLALIFSTVITLIITAGIMRMSQRLLLKNDKND